MSYKKSYWIVHAFWQQLCIFVFFGLKCFHINIKVSFRKSIGTNIFKYFLNEVIQKNYLKSIFVSLFFIRRFLIRGNPENMLLRHIFRFYLTIVFKRKFFQQFLRMHTSHQFTKKRDISVLTNYPPFSVTPTFEKVFERLLINQLVEYLEKFALLNKKQFGFQSRKSSTNAVLYFIEKRIRNMDDNNNTEILLNFSIQLHIRPFSRKLKLFISLNPQFYFSNFFSQIEHKA